MATFNIDNYDKAAARYQDFKAWTREHAGVAGVGLDIEMDINEITLCLSLAGAAAVRRLLRKFVSSASGIARRGYQALVDEIADGYPVESYQFRSSWTSAPPVPRAAAHLRAGRPGH